MVASRSHLTRGSQSETTHDVAEAMRARFADQWAENYRGVGKENEANVAFDRLLEWVHSPLASCPLVKDEYKTHFLQLIDELRNERAAAQSSSLSLGGSTMHGGFLELLGAIFDALSSCNGVGSTDVHEPQSPQDPRSPQDPPPFRWGGNRAPVGGAPRRRKPVAEGKAPPKWVSTGRQTTLKDGSKRTVYRNSKTGERATKRMIERNGKRTAKYVKI